MRFALFRQIGALLFGSSKKNFIKKAKTKTRHYWIDFALSQATRGTNVVQAPAYQSAKVSRQQIGSRLSKTRGTGNYMTMVADEKRRILYVVL